MTAGLRRAAGWMVGLGVAWVGTSAWSWQDPPEVKPTAEHERLARDVGTWDATIKVWTGGPESEPEVSKGVEVNRMLPGGLWLISDFEGQFGDQKFHGHGVYGYDPRKRKFVGSWADSMSSELLAIEGEYDPKNHTFTYRGRAHDPAGKPYESIMVTHHKGDDTRAFSMSIKADELGNQEVKVMEIVYQRRAQ